MADFLKALELTLKEEGFYGNDKDDSGGETIWGIARKMNPHWGGWAIVDSNKNRANFPACLKSNNMLVGMRNEFYRVNFWLVAKGDEVINQDVANDLFDKAVNTGVKQAIILCQRSLSIKESGVMDKLTVSKLNESNPYV